MAVLGLYNVPSHLLNLRCKEENLGAITTNFRWRVAAPFMHLSRQQMEDIEVEGRSEQERRILTLRTWMETFGDRATYYQLIRALDNAKLKEQALNVAVTLLRYCRPISISKDSISKDTAM